MTLARKFACALLAVAVVVAVVYATGAFSSTTASRSADIEVAGHGSAFLSLQPSEGPNGKYASYGPGGALQVKIGGAGLRSAATGVNPDSLTVFKNVFTITNKGSQPVSVWITDNNPAVTFIGPSGRTIEGRANARPLTPGGRVLRIGLKIDARGVTPGTDLLESVTIRTSALKGQFIGGGDGSDGSDGGDGGDGGISGGDVVSSLWAMLMGFLQGGFGMPGGFWHYTAKEVESIWYFVGMMFNAIASMVSPALDIASAIRDLIASASQGNVVGVLLEAVGIVFPVLDLVEDASELVNTARKWLNAFAKKAGEVLSLLADTFLKHLPSSVGADILKALTDAPVKGLRKAGIPVEDIGIYAAQNANFQRILKLADKGVSPGSIRYYVKNDIWLKGISKLQDRVGSSKAVKRLMKEIERANEVDKFEITKDSIGSVDIPHEIVRKINKRVEVEGTHRLSEQVIAIAIAASGYQSWKDARQDSHARNQNQDIRQSIRRHYRGI